MNTPVQEGFEISTSADSFAEVEFENGSTARLGQLSHLAFDQLALDAEGYKLNRMTFEQGYATFHFLPEKHDAYSVKIAGATLTPSGKSMFRTDLDKGHVRVEVFNGLVEIAGPPGPRSSARTRFWNTTLAQLRWPSTPSGESSRTPGISGRRHGIRRRAWR